MVRHQAECSYRDQSLASWKAQNLLKGACADLVATKRQLIVCQVEKLKKTVIVARVDERRATLNTLVEAVMPLTD
jgi:hypothetical protein